ncbi:hypothetical protein GS911_02760 [Rhodococcus hoagii]|nr:hypothetical protein [Prescottella equi]
MILSLFSGPLGTVEPGENSITSTTTVAIASGTQRLSNRSSIGLIVP